MYTRTHIRRFTELEDLGCRPIEVKFGPLEFMASITFVGLSPDQADQGMKWLQRLVARLPEDAPGCCGTSSKNPKRKALLKLIDAERRREVTSRKEHAFIAQNGRPHASGTMGFLEMRRDGHQMARKQIMIAHQNGKLCPYCHTWPSDGLRASQKLDVSSA